jgi:hypothetical protein
MKTCWLIKLIRSTIALHCDLPCQKVFHDLPTSDYEKLMGSNGLLDWLFDLDSGSYNHFAFADSVFMSINQRYGIDLRYSPAIYPNFMKFGKLNSSTKQSYLISEWTKLICYDINI